MCAEQNKCQQALNDGLDSVFILHRRGTTTWSLDVCPLASHNVSHLFAPRPPRTISSPDKLSSCHRPRATLLALPSNMSTSARESPHAQQAHNVPPPSSAAEQAPPVIPRTSEVPFFSSLHGRERRDLRGIDRRDLQAAIKDGKKEPSWPHPATGEQR